MKPERKKKRTGKPGDRCNGCNRGRLRVYRTVTRGSLRRRYLACDQCKLTAREELLVDHLGRPVTLAK